MSALDYCHSPLHSLGRSLMLEKREKVGINRWGWKHNRETPSCLFIKCRQLVNLFNGFLHQATQCQLTSHFLQNWLELKFNSWKFYQETRKRCTECPCFVCKQLQRGESTDQKFPLQTETAEWASIIFNFLCSDRHADDRCVWVSDVSDRSLISSCHFGVCVQSNVNAKE